MSRDADELVRRTRDLYGTRPSAAAARAVGRQIQWNRLMRRLAAQVDRQLAEKESPPCADASPPS